MPIFENHTGLHRVGEVEFVRCETELVPSLVLGTVGPRQKDRKRHGCGPEAARRGPPASLTPTAAYQDGAQRPKDGLTSFFNYVR